MDIWIFTSDPEAVDADEIQQAIESLNYFVSSVEVNPRP